MRFSKHLSAFGARAANRFRWKFVCIFLFSPLCAISLIAEDASDVTNIQKTMEAEMRKLEELERASFSGKKGDLGVDFNLQSPVALNIPPPRSRIPGESDEAEDEEAEEKVEKHKSWLLDGVLKLSGEYTEEASLSLLPAEEEEADLYSTTLLIDKMSEYYNKKREEAKAEEEAVDESEAEFEETSFLTEDKVVLEVEQNVFDNPFIEVMVNDYTSAFKSEFEKSGLGAVSKQFRQTTTFNQTADLGRADVFQNADNPYLQAFKLDNDFSQNTNDTASNSGFSNFKPKPVTPIAPVSSELLQPRKVMPPNERYYQPKRQENRHLKRFDQF